MKKNVLIGNGLFVTVKPLKNELQLVFNGRAVNTSELVAITDFTMWTKHPHVKKESESYIDERGGGTASDISLKTTLKVGEKCVVLCNSQKTDAYVLFENVAGVLKHKTIAEQWFHTSDFQGVVNNEYCYDENKFLTFVQKLKTTTICATSKVRIGKSDFFFLRAILRICQLRNCL